MVQIPARKVEVQEEAFCKANHSGQRLDAVLPDLFSSRYSSASAGKKAIRRKEVQVNGSVARTDMLLQEGDVVRVVMKVGSGAVWGSTAGKPGLEVAFEDEHMACIVKPQGLPTQGTGEGTVQGRIKYCLQPSPLPGALFRPHHVHRLDVNTGGLLLVAKTRAAGTALAADLAQHKMQKRYLALVTGRLEGSGMIDYPLEGKPAVSLFRVEQQQPSATYGWLTWVSLWPKTGRTHQLRKHCAYIGHPILGDSHYMLHRKPDCQLQLLHPITRQPLDLSIEEQAAREYERICGIEAAAAAADDDHAQGRQQQQQQR
ncbi:hypothetical protein OEZ85_013101 [Tetradesmus obliquus]|uniref:Pseudouridine synthase RsuA/RluA-like domain-containing protein n=1 Tax=Tetradesmus obliquus TaxID=3088 RepID=A0ABY8U4U8_TETOB|nr:hypothetical protein OEZ85_013101 [Tetradesmus obliquus]